MITRIAAEYTAPRQGVYRDRGQGAIEAARSDIPTKEHRL
jgi:hypothetical protein